MADLTKEAEMPHCDDLCAKALTQRGDPYVFGAEAEFSDPNPDRFDCSELVQWAAARLGVVFADGAENQRNTCRNAGTLIPVSRGIHTRGALLFRVDAPPGDHVAISLGDGRTIEARGKDFGVNVFDATGRTWTDAGIVPGFDTHGARPAARDDGLLEKGDRGPDVKWVQRRLQVHGFDAGAPDGIFGERTRGMILAFQREHGLEVDGIVGRKTRRALKAKPKDPAASVNAPGRRERAATPA